MCAVARAPRWIAALARRAKVDATCHTTVAQASRAERSECNANLMTLFPFLSPHVIVLIATLSCYSIHYSLWKNSPLCESKPTSLPLFAWTAGQMWCFAGLAAGFVLRRVIMLPAEADTCDFPFSWAASFSLGLAMLIVWHVYGLILLVQIAPGCGWSMYMVVTTTCLFCAALCIHAALARWDVSVSMSANATPMANDSNDNRNGRLQNEGETKKTQ